MKGLSLLLIGVLLVLKIYSQYSIRQDNTLQDSTYWQQEVHYKIKVSLDDRQHLLNGKLDLEYTNNSPGTLRYIWFHIWPNAYSSGKTALAKQLKSRKDAKKFSEQEIGFIKDLSFKSGGKTLRTELDKENPDIIKVLLNDDLKPGSSINVSTPFTVKLPGYFSRSGFYDDQYMVTQWYPKPAVYDKNGWHQFPYLDQGEFYSEYGTFEVQITLPSQYVVGATGSLQTKEELELYKKLGEENRKDTLNYDLYKPSSTGNKTLLFTAENVHDFAWFADRNFVIQYDTLQIVTGKTIDVFSYFQPNGNSNWSRSTGFLKDAVKYYSQWIGDYPYPTVAAVEGPANQSSGGMEYPMITLITQPDADVEGLDAVITHEVGHNWFYGILGSNERDYPWMDEGFNTFFEFLYEAVKYKSNSIFGSSIPEEVKKLPTLEFLDRIYNAVNAISINKKINTSSTGFKNEEEYGMTAYLKTATWMFILHQSIGNETFFKGMNQYFEEWKFKHPYPEDFKRVFEKVAGRNLDEVFNLLNKEGSF
ncbi:MAG: M1 family metallopeptidase [Flavitalea sp.]